MCAVDWLLSLVIDAAAVVVEDMLTLKYVWVVFGNDEEQACDDQDYTRIDL